MSGDHGVQYTVGIHYLPGQELSELMDPCYTLTRLTLLLSQREGRTLRLEGWRDLCEACWPWT